MKKSCEKCGEIELLYGGMCDECHMERTGGNWAEECLAAIECGEPIRADN